MDITVQTNRGDALEVTFLTFAGGEQHVQLAEIPSLPVTSVNVKARVFDAKGVINLLLLTNALRHSLGATLAINLTLPYLPYSRQDRVCARGQAFSLEVMANLLRSMNLKSLATWDCHSSVGLALTGAVNIPPSDIISASPALVAELTNPQSVLVCPDEGAKSRCAAIARSLGVAATVQCYKKRNPESGEILCTEVMANDLSGKTAVITDDICDGGFTFIKLAEALRAKGADRVILYVTHGLFSKGLDVFDGLIDVVFTTGSVPRSEPDSRVNEIQFESV